MDLVATGADTRAFAVLYDRHASVAYALAYRICGRRSAAEEVVQDAFLAAWRGRASFQSSRGALRPWILALVRNRAIDTVRHASVTTSRDVHDDEVAAALPARERTDLEVERRTDAERVRGALEELPADQQRVIELAFFGGFTHTEIAVILGLPPGTVKGRMRLGLTRLRAALGEPENAMV